VYTDKIHEYIRTLQLYTHFPSNRTTEHPKRAVSTIISRAFSILSTHRCLAISSVYYNVKGIIEAPGSLSDRNPAVAASARARYSGASIYAGGRERRSIPQQNTHRSNATVEPHRASAGIFSQTWGQNNVTIHPWWPRWTAASAQRRSLVPHIPAHRGGKTTTFAGHLASFHARSKGSDGHARIFTCRAAVDVASRFAFSGWYRVVRVGPSARSRLVAI